MKKLIITLLVLAVPLMSYAAIGLGFKKASSNISTISNQLPSGGWIGTTQANGWTFTSDPYIYTTSASVGIGTASPSYPLHMLSAAGGAGSGLVVESDGTGTTGYASIDYIASVTFQTGLYPNSAAGTKSDKAFFFHDTADPIGFFTNATERFTILGNGNIGIADDASDSTLVVDGAAIFEHSINQAVDAEASDTYVVSLGDIDAYERGLYITLWANTANTGAATLNVNSLGAKDIKTISGADPANNDILADKPALLMYDGTNLILINPATTCD
jgi:hypothetical protein